MQQHGIASALHLVLSQLTACRLLTAACITTLPPTPQVPPALNRFTRTLDKNMAESLFKLLMKYRPEDKAAKKERLLKEAEVRGRAWACVVNRLGAGLGAGVSRGDPLAAQGGAGAGCSAALHRAWKPSLLWQTSGLRHALAASAGLLCPSCSRAASTNQPWMPASRAARSCLRLLATAH